MDDITLLRRAVDDATRLLDGIRPDQRELPTPCPDFSVGQLVDHLVEGAEMFAVAVDGGSESQDLSWKSVSGRLVAAFEARSSLDGTVTVPYAELPTAVALQHALGETAIHATDLAKSTGQSLSDDAVYERVFDVVGPEWRVENVLGPAVPCPDSASLIDRVQAFAGRTV